MEPKDNKEKTSSVLIDASTVIITREGSGNQYEIFLMRRHRNQAFMGGAYVFPGGRLDDADCVPELEPLTCGLASSEAKHKLQEPELANETAFGLFSAAVRETFEEAGILLAYTSSDKLIDFSDEEFMNRFPAYRPQLINNELTLYELAQKENIRYAFDLLFPYAHWITPEAEANVKMKRFDTRFFLARMPGGQLPIHDGMEMTDSLWITPADALEQQRKSQITLMPPTLKIIEELNDYKSPDQLFDTLDNHKFSAILPQPLKVEDGFGMKLPHDPEYTIEAYKQTPRPKEPSRIVMQDGIFQTKRVN